MENKSQNKSDTDCNFYITQSVINYLEMDTNSALMINGDWGSGKTYYVRNTLIPEIKKLKVYKPIIVSLYGEKNKGEIAKKTLLEFYNCCYVKNNDSLNIGKRTERVLNALDSITWLKDKIDLKKMLLGDERDYFDLMPDEKILICFDDLERLSDDLKIDEFLGIVNELIENKGYKVILIANKSKIDSGFKYEEKSVEKVVHFVPNIEDVLNNIINKYEDDYKKFLKTILPFIIETLTKESEYEEYRKDLKESFSNIRTLKFALEHFKLVFELINDERDINDNIVRSQLHNLWLFTLSISAEFKKTKSITFDDKKELDTQDAYFINMKNLNTLLGVGDDENKEKVNLSYSEVFVGKYYSRHEEKYFFYDEVYNLITAGINIKSEKLLDFLDEKYNVKNGKRNPAHELLDQILWTNQWKGTDEEFVQILNKLREYFNNGCFENIKSYLDVSWLLLKYNEIIGVERDHIYKEIKDTINTAWDKILDKPLMQHHINHYEVSFRGIGYMDRVFDIVIKRNNQMEKEILDEENENLQEYFESDMESFVSFLNDDIYNNAYNLKYILDFITISNIKNGFKNIKPHEVILFASFISSRYRDKYNYPAFKNELGFLNNIKKEIEDIVKDGANTITKYKFKYSLLPLVEEALEEINKSE